MQQTRNYQEFSFYLFYGKIYITTVRGRFGGQSYAKIHRRLIALATFKSSDAYYFVKFVQARGLVAPDAMSLNKPTPDF